MGGDFRPMLEHDDLQVLQSASAAPMRSIGSEHLGLLEAGGKNILVLKPESGRDGAAARQLQLPGTPEGFSAFCFGGDHIYLLGKGAGPKLWRVSAPAELLRGAGKDDVAEPSEEAEPLALADLSGHSRRKRRAAV